MAMLTRETLEEKFAAYAEHFSRPEVFASATKAAQETAAWMRLNTGNIDVYGTPIERPWFDEAANASALPCKMAEKARHHTLDARCYEHGIAKYLELAASYNVLSYDEDEVKSLVMLRSGEVEGWFHILNRYSWVEGTMNLGHFASTGDGHPDAPSSHSKKKLVKLAKFGFAVVLKPEKAFDIKVGPVAKAFYDEVWFPITEEFKTKIATWQEEGK
ncbi:MAG: hypothetical protein P1V13_22395 [Rhizobiaceae bacterium]|nr:hypothetical protein [Rhizobiaceae bacterium]